MQGTKTAVNYGFDRLRWQLLRRARRIERRPTIGMKDRKWVGKPDRLNWAIRPTADRPFDELVRLARAKLGALPRGESDEEDAALSAFHSFCQGAARGRFPRLDDRHDLHGARLGIRHRREVSFTAESPAADGRACRCPPAGGSARRSAGPPDGRPVLALHGWPQHHWEWRDLLADPPPGMRIIAPDLPGYGWSGPAPHLWAKADVAKDVLALLDAMALDRVLLLAHDWGAYAGYVMVLDEPQRFEGYLACDMAHPWVSAREVPSLPKT